MHDTSATTEADRGEPTRRTYTGARIDVSFDAALCEHSTRCVRGLPEVFDTTARPWIQPDGADPQRVADLVATCPSRALLSVMHPETTPH